MQVSLVLQAETSRRDFLSLMGLLTGLSAAQAAQAADPYEVRPTLLLLARAVSVVPTKLRRGCGTTQKHTGRPGILAGNCS
jgi:hypothetical protein